MTTDSQRDLLTQIFEAQRRSLIGTLYRMVGCLATSEDLAHDAYLRVAKAVRERPVTHLQAFLYQTARNLALDHLRRERIRGGFMSEAPDGAAASIAAPQPSQETAVIDAQRLNQVEGALSALPERARKALTLSRLEGLTYPEIARRLGVSENTVYNDIRAALAHCLASLDDGGDGEAE
jgi:RNA polymerase sigma-70 factor (ECF subfamily)